MSDNAGAALENAGADIATPGDPNAATPPEDKAGQGAGQGSNGNQDDLNAAYAALTDDEATREWLQKHGLREPSAIAKKAHELDKFVGGAVKLPGKDATDEERAAFYNKLGRPPEPTGYEFKVPESMPENLPYDEGFANDYRDIAHRHGLTATQAAALHDWFVGEQVKGVETMVSQNSEQLEQRAVAERAKLEKVWGPVDSETGRKNAALADRALRSAPPEFMSDLQRAGMLGPRGEVLNANLGVFMSTLGAAIFQEGEVVRGDASAIGNPFADGDNFNLTNAMRLVKNDPDHALVLIAAAGKKPEDFGLGKLRQR